MTSDWKADLGARVRGARHARGLTLRALAERARLSVRFVSDVEAGRANPSLGSLRDLAEALDSPLARLVLVEGGAVHERLHAMVEALPPSAALAAERLLGEATFASESAPLVLLGLRGAGKSAVGRALSKRIGRPFSELDRILERESGMSLGDLFELHGEAHVRALEARVLDELLDAENACILAAGGGIVTQPESFARLRSRAVTVWLRASPQAHWDRVIAQGDLRPMANRSRARAELEALYTARAPLYAKAQLVVDTDALTVDEVAAHIAETLSLGDASDTSGREGSSPPESASLRNATTEG